MGTSVAAPTVETPSKHAPCAAETSASVSGSTRALKNKEEEEDEEEAAAAVSSHMTLNEGTKFTMKA